MRKRFLFIAPAAIVGIIALMALGGFVVEQLWNWLTPALFGWHAMTFWQALGLLALCRILFGGLGRHGHRRGPRGGWRGKGRWTSMTPDEREHFRQRMRDRYGFDPADTHAAPTV